MPSIASITTRSQDATLSIIILVGSGLSIIGASLMILSFILVPSLRTFRHQLILGLAISDLLLATNFFASSLATLLGHDLYSTQLSTLCSANGFITQLCFSQIDFWQLTIAITTFICMPGCSKATMWFKQHVGFFWILPWGGSVATAAVALYTWGYQDTGAVCWFRSLEIHLLYNFLPRWVIIITTISLYSRIYFIIRRARKSAVISSLHKLYNMPDMPDLYHGYPGTQPYILYPPQLESGEDEGPGSPLDESKARIVSRQMMAFPMAYAAIWMIPTGIMIYELTFMKDGQKIPLALDAVAKSFIVLQGFVDAHIYGFNERTTLGWLEALRNIGRSRVVQEVDYELPRRYDIEFVPLPSIHDPVPATTCQGWI